MQSQPLPPCIDMGMHGFDLTVIWANLLKRPDTQNRFTAFGSNKECIIFFKRVCGLNVTAFLRRRTPHQIEMRGNQCGNAAIRRAGWANR